MVQIEFTVTLTLDVGSETVDMLEADAIASYACLCIEDDTDMTEDYRLFTIAHDNPRIFP